AVHEIEEACAVPALRRISEQALDRRADVLDRPIVADDDDEVAAVLDERAKMRLAETQAHLALFELPTKSFHPARDEDRYQAGGDHRCRCRAGDRRRYPTADREVIPDEQQGAHSDEARLRPYPPGQSNGRGGRES